MNNPYLGLSDKLRDRARKEHVSEALDSWDVWSLASDPGSYIKSRGGALRLSFGGVSKFCPHYQTTDGSLWSWDDSLKQYKKAQSQKVE